MHGQELKGGGMSLKKVDSIYVKSVRVFVRESISGRNLPEG